MKTQLILVPAEDGRILALEADALATKQLAAGADLDTVKFKGKVIDHAVAITFENGQVLSIDL